MVQCWLMYDGEVVLVGEREEFADLSVAEEVHGEGIDLLWETEYL